VAREPKVELATGTIMGAEALLRWNNPIFGLQPPSRFIPIAEESGLIIDMGAWALRTAAAFAVQINRGRAHPLEFSVNVSQIQFRDHDLPSIIGIILRETGAHASWLKLELTESLLADHSPAMIAMLRELREMGVGLAIDDFGTGYSSLNYLEVFPISEIKIDRSFVSQVDSNRSRRVIVDAMVRLGEELQISVVAEGAETEEEIAALRTLRCPYVQGHFFGQPIPETEFIALVQEHFEKADVDLRPASAVTGDRLRTAILVEDDPLVLKVLSDTLEQLGWAVVEVSDAEAALALPESLVPEIVITDVNLGPGLNGFELCSLARNRWPAAGIIVISGRPASNRQMGSFGAKEIFLQKPVRLPVLEAAIARVRERDFEDNGQPSAAKNPTGNASGTA
jgi:EAL domain-containing protein (putative c-di-GMP-specific phosphodiesterase class I)/CheY-like chemotaxis protein